VVHFSFEHDNHSLLERLIIMEAAEIAGLCAVRLPAVRLAFETRQGPDKMMQRRLADIERAGSRRFTRRRATTSSWPIFTG
jgi:hypothetical protein